MSILSFAECWKIAFMCNLTRGFRSFVNLLVKTSTCSVCLSLSWNYFHLFCIAESLQCDKQYYISCLVWNIHIFALSAIKTAWVQNLPDSTSLIENRLKMEGTDILGALSSFQLPVESTTHSNMTTKEESNSPTLSTNEELASYVC